MADWAFWKHLGRTSDVLGVLGFMGISAASVGVLAHLGPPDSHQAPQTPPTPPSVQSGPTKAPEADSGKTIAATTAVTPAKDGLITPKSADTAGETREPKDVPRAATESPAPAPAKPFDPAAPRIDTKIEARVVEQPPLPPQTAPNITVGSVGWIHAGTYSHLFLEVGTWDNRKLDFSGTASPSRLLGMTRQITSTVPLNLRSAPPNKQGTMGEVLGTIQPSQYVQVIDVFGEKEIWLKIRLMPPATVR